MPLTVEDAKPIMQAATIDIWNAASQPERRKLMEKYFSPEIKAYAPDGSETVGYDAVCWSSPEDYLVANQCIV